MKKMKYSISVLLLVCLTSVSAFAGTSAEKKHSTKLEAFLAQKGEIIVKDSYEMGSTIGLYLTDITVTALVIYKPGRKEDATKGVQIRVTKPGTYEKVSVAFLDIEEMETLSKAITYMMNLAEKWATTEREYTEVIFLTAGDFKIGFYQTGIDQKAFLSAGRIGAVTAFMPKIQSLQIVKRLIDQGLVKLKGE